MRRSFKSVHLTCALLLSAAALPALADAPGDTHKVQIAAQPLATALVELSRQTDVVIVAPAELVEGKRAPSVSGQLLTGDALEKLLKDSGLHYSRGAEGEVTIVRKSAAGSKDHAATVPTAATSDVARSAESMRLAQSEGRVDDEKKGDVLEEVVVTGSHLRGVSSTAPVMTFTRTDFEKAGFSQIADLFESLPQNVNTISPGGMISTGSSSLAGQNTQAASGISLRGLGPESTLVLLNGTRRPGNVYGRVTDISAIPLSAIERVEIVTGGRSAVYGSDAVAGVVNLITRRGFEGAETQLSYGAAAEGGDRVQFSQILGYQRDDRGVMFAYDFDRQLALDLADTGVLRNPGTFGYEVHGFDVVPHLRQHSGLLSGHYDTGTVDFHADALYTDTRNDYRTSFGLPGVFDLDAINTNHNRQYSASGGARAKLGSDWNFDASGTYGEANVEEFSSSNFGDIRNRVNAGIRAASLVLDGAVHLPFVTPQLAVGAENRRETFTRFNELDDVVRESLSRRIDSAFIELQIPVVPQYRGEISLAARYDDYSDFGHAFTWQGGLAWEPVESVRLRASYATSFRAPDLYTLALKNSATLQYLSDPSAPGGVATVLYWGGGNSGLRAEHARNWTGGFDFKPAAWPLRISGSYFQISYSGRIDQPAQGADIDNALVNSDRYPSLIDRAPDGATVDEIVAQALQGFGFYNSTSVAFNPNSQSLLALVPNLLIFDNRQNNVAVERVRGLDAEVNADFGLVTGRASVALNGTYYLDFDRRVTASSPAFGQLDQPGQALKYRLRASFGWSKGWFSGNAYLNYVPGYDDTIAQPNVDIASWITTDVTLQVKAPAGADVGLWRGLSATLAATNLFDRAPPAFRSSGFGYGYDPINANPLGRQITVRLTRKW